MPHFTCLLCLLISQFYLQRGVVVERSSSAFKDRMKTQTKPSYCPPSQRQGGRKSVPTITQNGPEGSKVFMSITLPKDTLIDNGKTKRSNHRPTRELRSAPAGQSMARRELLYSAPAQPFKPGTPALLESSSRLSQRKTLVQRENPRPITRSQSAQEKLTVAAEPTLRRSSAVHVDVNIPTAGEEISVISSGIMESTMGSDDMNNSCDLDDVKSENSELLREPTPPPQVPAAESTEAMKERIHRDLLRTISETDQFLQDMDSKRKNKPHQIIYSDEEDDVIGHFTNTAATQPYEPEYNIGHVTQDMSTGEICDHLLPPSHHMIPTTSLTACTEIRVVGKSTPANNQIEQPHTHELLDHQLDLQDDADFDDGFLPPTSERKSSAQIFLDLVHQIEQDQNDTISDESDAHPD